MRKKYMYRGKEWETEERKRKAGGEWREKREKDGEEKGERGEDHMWDTANHYIITLTQCMMSYDNPLHHHTNTAHDVI